MTQYTGSVPGTHARHDENDLAKVWAACYTDRPEGATGKLPVFLFLHGSSGINPATRELGRFIASLGFLFVAPDSMAVADRLAYTSPVAPEVYETVHAMRLSELEYAVDHLNELPEFDGRFVIAGTSEGGVSVARFASRAERPEAARLLFSWSCEDNYHVDHHRTNIPDSVPVLNLMSAEDKFFSRANAYLGNDDALGHAGKALAKHPDATIVLLPGAPHTLFNLPAAHRILRGFLEGVLPL